MYAQYYLSIPRSVWDATPADDRINLVVHCSDDARVIVSTLIDMDTWSEERTAELAAGDLCADCFESRDSALARFPQFAGAVVVATVDGVEITADNMTVMGWA